MKTAVWCMVALVGALAGCTEKLQSHGQVRNDAVPYAGTGKAFVDPGWKQGDEASWEQHLKVRLQRGQNDYYGNKN